MLTPKEQLIHDILKISVQHVWLDEMDQYREEIKKLLEDNGLSFEKIYYTPEGDSSNEHYPH